MWKALYETKNSDIMQQQGGFLYMAVKIDKDTCIGCGACVGVCPVSALSLDSEGKSECNADLCIDCHACIGTCPVGAITE